MSKIRLSCLNEMQIMPAFFIAYDLALNPKQDDIEQNPNSSRTLSPRICPAVFGYTMNACNMYKPTER